MPKKDRIHRKTFIQLVLVIVCAAFAIGIFAQHSSNELVLDFTGLSSNEGILQIALFKGEKGYMQEDKAILHRYEVASLNKGRLTISNLPVGVYAIAVFQDINANGRLDKNFLGIPSEPYGFSGKNGGKWGVPRFEQAAFELKQGSNFQTIRLHRLLTRL